MGAKATKLKQSIMGPPRSTMQYIRDKTGGVMAEDDIKFWYIEFNVSSFL